MDCKTDPGVVLRSTDQGIRCVLIAAIVCLLFSMGSPRAARAGADVTQAIKVSQRTGKPIFAVAGASYCPACVRLMNTLNSDESLQPYIDQFVPLKLNAQSDDYKRWKQFFPPKRSAIPALFIVTPDGKELYSAVGALPTKSLQKVMLTSLEKAERYPTKQQWEEIVKSLATAEQALADEDLDTAFDVLLPRLHRLSQMEALLPLADEGSQVIATIEKLTKTQQEMLDSSLHSFVSKGDFKSAMDVTALEQMLTSLPRERKAVAVAIKRAIRDPEQKALVRQARELRQAQAIALQPASKKQQRQVVAAYKRIAKRYPKSEAADIAEQRLQSHVER